MKSKKCFVTGGAGLIGIHTCYELVKLGYDVSIYDLGEQIERHKKYLPKNLKIHYGSILDLHTLQSAMMNHDYVFHLAAMLGVQNTEDNKLDCLEINCTGTKYVLQSAVNNKIKKVIFASSSEVYGEPDKNPINENFSTKGKTLYGISKIVGEEYCKSFYQKYKLNYTIIRFFNTYGPLQKNKFVITKFIDSILNKKNLTINGSGEQLRSYMYVTDAAKATTKIAFSKNTNQKIYNVGNGSNPISLNTLIKKIKKITKIKPKIKYDKNFISTDRLKKREIFERFCDSSKIQKTIKWKPTVSIEDGIKQIIKSLKNEK